MDQRLNMVDGDPGRTATSPASPSTYREVGRSSATIFPNALAEACPTLPRVSALFVTVANSSLCPWCGAYSPRQCELEEETGGVCPWEESGEYEEPDDPDRRREDRDEMRRVSALFVAAEVRS